ncbi:NAD(P)/FAD-dependent oxidoreductase [Polluticoccus soli]|uniref:NAD(P)/FAD-dependent oxidoreductase n=1 Tax=Polluticoccus soli TaxID=3034150 RepID=UPI0023E2F240|nr:NAD(P)/FAD-dependent oxidoreductase [Flavipsychrobacter sp. JY13-12]
MRIAIIGAGAAGCFAAANIPWQEGREVTVFEKTGKALQKVKVSGGGRCNTTHACFDVPELIDRYPRGKPLLRRSLYQFSPQDTISWFGERGVRLKTEEDGRMFPVTDNSQTIIDCIWQEMMKQKVQVRYHKAVERIEKTDDGLRIDFGDKTFYTADRVLIACGGFPKKDQYAWLEQLGHKIETPVPSLFTFNIPKHPITELMGVSVPTVTVKIQGTKIVEQGPILITHWGLSGPVVLRTSAWGARELAERNYNFKVQINWLNDRNEQDLKDTIAQIRRERGKQAVQFKNLFDLPKRLWEYLLHQCGIKDETKWGDLPAAQQNKLIEKLVRDTYEVKGKTTFKEEFVTCGGISLSQIDAQTMESKLIPGLYFGGEILDVDGITGGFNFQNAWSSGYIAAQSVIKEK